MKLHFILIECLTEWLKNGGLKRKNDLQSRYHFLFWFFNILYPCRKSYPHIIWHVNWSNLSELISISKCCWRVSGVVVVGRDLSQLFMLRNTPGHQTLGPGASRQHCSLLWLRLTPPNVSTQFKSFPIFPQDWCWTDGSRKCFWCP